MTIKSWQSRVASLPYVGDVTPTTGEIARAMEAEIAELRAEAARLQCSFMDGFEGGKQQSRDAAHTEIAELRARVTELEAETQEPMTDDEIMILWDAIPTTRYSGKSPIDFARAVLAAQKETK